METRFYKQNDSKTIKKGMMFNKNVSNNKDYAVKVINGLNKRKCLIPKSDYKDFQGKNGKKKREIKFVEATKEYTDENIENQRKEVKKVDRKISQYLKLGENALNSYKTLFASRLFNYIGCPTFNAYSVKNNGKILVEKMREDDPFHFDLPPKPSNIEEINRIKREFEEARRLYIIRRFYQDEIMARQFIRRNIVANFFADKDVNVGNVVCNDETKELKHIDINFSTPTTIFHLGNILEGYSYCSLNVFNVMNDANYTEYHENRKLEDFGKFIGVDFIKSTIKEEYLNLTKKNFFDE